MKHLRSYKSFMIFESMPGESNFLSGLKNVVDGAINSSSNATLATSKIKKYIDINKPHILVNLADPVFIKTMMSILTKWHDAYGKELMASEFDTLFSPEQDLEVKGDLDYIPSDETYDEIEFKDTENLGDLF